MEIAKIWLIFILSRDFHTVLIASTIALENNIFDVGNIASYLYRSRKYLFSPATFQIYKKKIMQKVEYCCHILDRAPPFLISSLSKKHHHGLLVVELLSTRQPFSHPMKRRKPLAVLSVPSAPTSYIVYFQQFRRL